MITRDHNVIGDGKDFLSPTPDGLVVLNALSNAMFPELWVACCAITCTRYDQHSLVSAAFPIFAAPFIPAQSMPVEENSEKKAAHSDGEQPVHASLPSQHLDNPEASSSNQIASPEGHSAEAAQNAGE